MVAVNSSRTISIATGVVIILIGLALLLFPQTFASFVGIFVGIALIIATVRLINNWREARGSLLAGFYLVSGVIVGLLGVLCLLNPAGLLKTFGWLIALCITVAGIVEFIISLRAKKEGYCGVGALVSSGAVALLGIIAVAFPSVMLQLIGAALACEGVTALFTRSSSSTPSTNAANMKPSNIRPQEDRSSSH